MLLVAFAAAPVSAQQQVEGDKELAKTLYNQGKTQFDLGNFEESVRLFKSAYEAAGYPAFLFNIAQAYRQMGDCKQALFFYKRYLSVSGDQVQDNERALVEKHISDLTTTCKANEDIKSKPPLGAKSPDEAGGSGGSESSAGDTTGGAATGGDVSGGGEVSKSAVRTDPRLIALGAEAGAAFLRTGVADIDGAKFSLLVSADYPLSLGKLGVSFGGLFTYTPVPWEKDGTKGSVAFAGALAHGVARYWVMERLALRADVGLGVLSLVGLSEGDVFIAPEVGVTGALSVFHVRAAVGAEYLVTNNIALSVTPIAYSRSSNRNGLRDDIDSLSRIEVTLGLGYRR
jgi:hypothetical protein